MNGWQEQTLAEVSPIGKASRVRNTVRDFKTSYSSSFPMSFVASEGGGGRSIPQTMHMLASLTSTD